MTMDNTGVSGELASSQQHVSLESQQNPDILLDLSELVYSSDDSNKWTKFTRSVRRAHSNIKGSHKAIFGSVSFTSIVMAIGILIVCLTAPKSRKSCQSNFITVIDHNSVQYNSYPRSVVAGDLNHDNLLDIVVVNSGTNNIGIFLNYGNGTFTPQITFTTGDSSRPVSLALGDFNNDTHLDIVVVNYDTHNIGIFLGYGNGTFASQTTFSTGVSRPVSIAVGDFNNDHWLDIVITNNGTSSIDIFFGYENGSFGNHIIYSTGYDSLPYFVVVADFNHDHYMDIAVANYGTDNVGVFLGHGNGHFTTQITYSTSPQSRPYSIAVNDFNNDGQLDIAVANSGTNNVSILLGNGNGTFLSQTTYSISPGSRPQSIIIGDFNRDNQLDIAVSNYDTNNISTFIGYGNGSFATPTMHSTGIDSGPIGMSIGDFNNDNQSDIAVVNSRTNNVFVLIGYSMIQSKNPTAYSTGDGSSPFQIAIGDFDNDTQLDLAVVNSGTDNVGVFFGYGNGSFQEQVTYSTGNASHPYALTVRDLDNDYRLDILVANPNTESLGILYGYGNGSFVTIVTYSTGDYSYPRSVAVDDFNNDNHLDIVLVDYNNDNIGIFLGYGNRTFGNLTTYSTGDSSRPCSIATGDLNNDGLSDIAIANYGSGNIGIFLGSGNGMFAFFTFYSTGNSSLLRMLTISDLNKDNCLDIIVANAGTDNIGVFFGFGNGSFATQLTYSTGAGSGPSWISVADFNSDDWLDIAVANSGKGNVGVFLGSAYGYFGSQSIYPTGSSSYSISTAVGDFNKDNRLDIAVANRNINNVAVLLGHPSEVSTNTTVNNAPVLLGDYYADFVSQTTYSTDSDSRPYSIAFGDLNNDTQMDLVVANSGNGNVGVLFGYGNGSFATETIYSVGIGSSPRHVLIGDVNRDNLSDIAITNPNNDAIIVLLGSGKGTFSTEKMIYSTGSGSNPNTVALANFNNDKYLDLVVTNKGTDTIGIFFGFDYTSFARQKPITSGENSNPFSVATGDFNSDGHLDIAAGLFESNNVGVFLGYGNGSFTPVMTYSYVPSSHPFSVAVGDFNNDNHLDITVANWGINSVGVLLGYGDGTFAESLLYSTGPGTRLVSVAIGDFNNDKCLDITTANFGGNSIGVFLGYGNGTFRNVITYLTGKGSQPSSVTVFDINNDTQPDIIVANTGTSNAGVFLGYGNGSFAAQMTSSTSINSAPQYATAGDFNRDGQLDIVTANLGTSSISLLYGYGNGTFGNLRTYTTGVGSRPQCVSVGDFNNDNILDIIVSDNMGILFGYGDGTFASISTVPTGADTGTNFIAVDDFNNDNRLDFIVAGDAISDDIGVYLSYGSEPFGGQTTFFVGDCSSPSSVAVGHFNNDSQLDIAMTNYGTNNIGILIGYGNRMFSNVTTYSTGNDSHPLSLAIGDFNNDSLTDIVVANSASNNIVVLIGDGHGSFSTLMTYSVGDSSQPVSIAVGDFNRDYRLDIAVANSGTNNMCLLFGEGDGTFSNQTWYPLDYDSRPNWVVFADVNKDGWEDITVAAYGIDNIKILLNLC